MNNTEKKLILETYKQQYIYYKLSDFKSEVEKEKIKGMESILKILNVDITETQNSVIFEDNAYLIDTWKDICNYINANTYKTYTQDNINWLIDEIQFTSDSDKQYKARLTIIDEFIDKVNKKGIKTI